MANQVGEQMGQIVAQGIADVSENSHETDAKAEEIYQGMKKNSDEIITDWKVPSLLISLPVKPLINPFFKNIEKTELISSSPRKFQGTNFIAEHS
jgi:hypothetical protein